MRGTTKTGCDVDHWIDLAWEMSVCQIYPLRKTTLFSNFIFHSFFFSVYFSLEVTVVVVFVPLELRERKETDYNTRCSSTNVSRYANYRTGWDICILLSARADDAVWPAL